VKAGSLWGFVDKTGVEKILPQYLSVHPFINGIARVGFTDGTTGYINKSGSVVWKGTLSAGKSSLRGESKEDILERTMERLLRN
jgi:hypothetical protein